MCTDQGGPQCTVNGGSCSTNSDCCSNNCSTGTCAGQSQQCTGDATLISSTAYRFSVASTDPQGDQLFYEITWGDGATERIPATAGTFANSGDVQEVVKTFTSISPLSGFSAHAVAEDVHGNRSLPSRMSICVEQGNSGSCDSCTAWSPGQCAGGSCQAWQREETRTCTVGSCSVTQCVNDTTCGTPPPPLGLWTSAQELAGKPLSGHDWDDLTEDANQDFFSNPSAADQGAQSNVQALAAAIVYARCTTSPSEPACAGHEDHKTHIEQALDTLVSRGKPTDGDGRTLGVAREVGAWVIAADLIGYRTTAFEQWVRDMAENYVFAGETLLEMFKRRPNNWGAKAFGSLPAMYGYLGDTARLDEVYNYWVAGMEGNGAGHNYQWNSNTTWFCPKSPPSPAEDRRLINPANCSLLGVDLSGLIPEDQRRGSNGNFTGQDPVDDVHIDGWIDGAIMGARIFDRLGYPIWDVDNQAFKRMIIAHEDTWGSNLQMKAGKDWPIPIIIEAYGSELDYLQRQTSTDPGKSKNAGYVAYIVQ